MYTFNNIFIIFHNHLHTIFFLIYLRVGYGTIITKYRAYYKIQLFVYILNFIQLAIFHKVVTQS